MSFNTSSNKSRSLSRPLSTFSTLSTLSTLYIFILITSSLFHLSLSKPVDLSRVTHQGQLTPSNKQDIKTVPCRDAKDFVLCVHPPLDIDDADDWCPRRQCERTFVEAQPCHPDKSLRSTHKCRVDEMRSEFWECLPGQLERLTTNPKTNVKEITCSCAVKSGERSHLRMITEETFICPE